MHCCTEEKHVLHTFHCSANYYLSNPLDTQKDKNGLNELVAFVINNEITIENLRARLEKELVAYKIPTKIIFVEELPLGINGKIDKSKLFSLPNAL